MTDDRIDNADLWRCLNEGIALRAGHANQFNEFSVLTTVQRQEAERIARTREEEHDKGFVTRFSQKRIRIRGYVTDVDDTYVGVRVHSVVWNYLMPEYSSEREVLDGGFRCRYPSELRPIAIELNRNAKVTIEGTLTIVSSQSGMTMTVDLIELTPSKAACFIATAAYGDDSAPEVEVLRRYRDERLLRTRMGKRLVRVYYAVSPPLARLIAGSALLRLLVRVLCLAPLGGWLLSTAETRSGHSPMRAARNGEPNGV